MRIYINELIKLFCKRSMLGIFLALTVLNGVLLFVGNRQEDRLYTDGQYRAVYEDMKGKSAEQAYNELSDKKLRLRLIESLSYGGDISYYLEMYPDLDIDELMTEQKSKSYLHYTDLLYTEQVLIEDVLKEVESCAKYEDYLTGIDETAKKMTGISLFADPDSFSYKNIKKTPGDFAHLKGSTLEIAPSKGVTMATDFLATDVIALLMIMTAAVTLVTREKELDQIILSRTTFKGRGSLGAAKLFACFTAALVALVLLYTVNFAMAGITYGFGDLGRQIQSVYGFGGSSLKISVLGYFALFLGSKLLVYLLLAALLYLIAVIFSTAVKVYASVVLLLAAESVLYYTIPSTSVWGLFKYVNIVAYANTKELFSDYLNLNIFGEPVNYIPVFVISAAVLLIGASVTAVIVFARKKVIRSRKSEFRLSSINLFSGRTVSVFAHELYKTFISGRVLLILVVFGAFVFYTYKPLSESFHSVDELYYKHYMTVYEGEYNAKKQAMIDTEDERIQTVHQKQNEELANGGGAFVFMKYQDDLKTEFAFERVKAHAEYLKTTENGEFLYDAGYKLLTGDESAGNNDATLALTALAMLICTLTYVYSIEYKTGAAVLLRTSPRGRGTVFVRKFLIGLIIITVIYALTYSPYFYNVIHAYGMRQLSASAASMEHLAGWDMSILAYLILISVLRYLGLIASMLMIFFISAKARSFISSLLIETAVLILPVVIYLLGISFFRWIGLTPLIIGNVM